MIDDNLPAHAKYSPSGASRWTRCHASMLLCKDIPNRSSSFADEGTCAHEVAEMALKAGVKAETFVGHKHENGQLCDDDMAFHVQRYIDDLMQYANGHDLHIEQRVFFGDIIGRPNHEAFGTSDAIVITNDGKEIQVHDLKFGRGVEVNADYNEQLMLYALGAVAKFDYLGDFETVRMVIHQPRTNHLSEWHCTIPELKAFGERVKEAASIVAKIEAGELPADQHLNPGEKQCQWCPARATCPAIANYLIKQMGDEWDNLDDLDAFKDQLKLADNKISRLTNEQLGKLLDLEDMIEGWMKAVRAQVEINIFDGQDVPGYKLVQGKLGNRQWRDSDEAETMLKSMRYKKEEMYDFKLISPTTAEKLTRGSPKRWKALTTLITQKPGQPHVAKESDKRPALAIQPTAEDFDVISAVDDLL